MRRLRRYVGRKVLITTAHDEPVTGRLDGVDADWVELVDASAINGSTRKDIKGQVLIPMFAIVSVQVV